MNDFNLSILILILFFTASACGTTTISDDEITGPGAYRMQLDSDGTTREYIAYLPESFDENLAYPVVFVFHGGGGQAETTFENNNWQEKADDEQFITIFPEGSREDPDEPANFNGNPQSWNDGSGRSAIGAVQRDADDIQFIEELIDDLQTRFNINPNNLFATGFSNGASMSFRIGRELPHHFTAIAPVAGSDWLPEVQPETPPDLLYITGTEDPLNPFDGGNVYLGQQFIGTKPPVEEMILEWSELHNCSNNASTEIESNIRTYSYGCGESPKPVKMLALVGHGHHWPGSTSLLPAFIVGPNATDLDATETIWTFFEPFTDR